LIEVFVLVNYMKVPFCLRWMIACCLMLVIPSLWAGSSSPEGKKTELVMGWREYTRIAQVPVTLIAKLDTGAKTSSLHAENIEIFKKAGKEWVRFSFYWNKSQSTEKLQPIWFERPLVREVIIKEHKYKSHRRPVVTLELMIANQKHLVEFSLVSRHKFNYPVLLGRAFIRQAGVIDPSASYLLGKPPILDSNIKHR
jgi:hypothetical protein